MIEIMGMAAETIRRYAHHRYPGMPQPAVNLTIMAGMLEWEAKQWAARIVTSDDEDVPEAAFRVRQIGRA